MVEHTLTTADTAIRRYPIGVELTTEADGVASLHARVWAPAASKVELVIEDDRGCAIGSAALAAEATGYYSGFVPNAEVGARYRFRIDDGEAFPDPASRFQPDGPNGPSVVVDPSAFPWTDDGWRGVSIEGQVICEVHIGTFTRRNVSRRDRATLRVGGYGFLQFSKSCRSPNSPAASVGATTASTTPVASIWHAGRSARAHRRRAQHELGVIHDVVTIASALMGII
jgi:pullulanase/glycogen debranching enzyme